MLDWALGSRELGALMDMSHTLRSWIGRGFGLGLLLGLVASSDVSAGVFTTPRFVEPGNWSLGLEPELTLTSGSGIGANLRFTHGLTELNNLTAIIGTGSGPRRFRAGGNLTFDFFPDIEGQPGIGIATQALYVRKKNYGVLEVTAIPYVHKTFVDEGNEIEPFVAFPIGWGFRSSRYDPLMQLVVGALFKQSEDFRYSLELGIDVNRSDTYVSGGIAYYY